MNFDVEESRVFLTQCGINRFKINEWLEMLSSNDFDIFEYDRLVFYFAANIDPIDGFASRESRALFLSKIEQEIYERFMDKKFIAKTDVFAAISFSTAIQAITNATSLDAKTVNMFFAFILTEAMHIGIDAWCRYYETKIGKKDGL